MIFGNKWTQALRNAKQVRALISARLYLRHCTRVGPYTRLVGRPRVQNHGTLVIGDHVLIHSTPVPIELVTLPGGALEIGDHSFLNYGTSISAHQSVRIGRHCLLGNYVNIMDNNWHDVLDRTKLPQSHPVTVEDNVWLGNKVIVLPGVTIGHDTVVGAGSVVTKDLPPRCIAVGNPARIARYF